MMGISLKKSVGAVAMVVAMAGVVAPGVASAGGTGNTTNNCYGVYYNTDWDQKCWSAGASATGYYKSTADCTGSGDWTLTAFRNAGSTTTHDGHDCTFQVVGVNTVFYT